MPGKKIILIAGARPNFMKIAPLIRHLKNYKIIFTGQHYGKMAHQLFLPYPKEPGKSANNYSLDLRTSNIPLITTEIKKILAKERPDLVIVVGDVNSTLAGARAAKLLNIKLAHVEAGLRSFDNSMPEEINRRQIDALSDYFFVTEPSGVDNLRKEGITKNVFLVGNTMIDSLAEQDYAVLTLHRPSNVDSREKLIKILRTIIKVNMKIKIIFPIHPRTKKNLKKFGIYNNLEIIDPLPYPEFIKLMKGARFVLTDSGGIQEETTYLNIPCLTLRENTERPITIDEGTNVLVGLDEKKILREVTHILEPKIWDGKASERICKIINSI